MMQFLNTEYAGNVNININSIGFKNNVTWIGKIKKMEKKNTEYRLMILILVLYERD